MLENLLVAIDFAVIGHGLSTRQADDEVVAILEQMGLADKAHVLVEPAFARSSCARWSWRAPWRRGRSC